MKTLVKLSLVFLLFNSLLIEAQSTFEGVIKYDMVFKDKTGEMSDEEAVEFMGDKQTYYILGNKYKSKNNGMLEFTQYYTGKDTLYYKMQGIAGLMYVDTKEQKEEILSFSIKENQLEVAGYSCDLLEVKTNEGSTLYYFNKAIRVDPEMYKNHQYGLWYFCLEKAGGALPLKLIADVEDTNLSIEAQEIELKDLDASIFEIPKGLPIVKSPE